MSDESIKRLLTPAESTALKPELKSSNVEIVLVQIADHDQGNLRKHVEILLSIAQEAGGFIISQMSCLILITFGLNIENYTKIKTIDLEKLSNRILATIGKSNAKILYGKCKADHGNLHVGNIFSYVMLIDGFNDIVARISAMSFGTSSSLQRFDRSSDSPS